VGKCLRVRVEKIMWMSVMCVCSEMCVCVLKYFEYMNICVQLHDF